jgi:hypothetical protein
MLAHAFELRQCIRVELSADARKWLRQKSPVGPASTRQGRQQRLGRPSRHKLCLGGGRLTPCGGSRENAIVLSSPDTSRNRRGISVTKRAREVLISRSKPGLGFDGTQPAMLTLADATVPLQKQSGRICASELRQLRAGPRQLRDLAITGRYSDGSIPGNRAGAAAQPATHDGQTDDYKAGYLTNVGG